MPSLTIKAYKATDSICKEASIRVSDFMRGQYFNDTLLYLSKYLHWMEDYDPITFCQFSSIPPENYLRPSIIKGSLVQALKREAPGRAIELVVAASYILHVAIKDTIIVYKYDEASNRDAEHGERPNVTIVSATVLDTLKGKVIPTVSSNPNVMKQKNQNIDKFQLEGNELIFSFSNFLLLHNSIPLNKDQGNAWLQPGREYILFLETAMLCIDDEYFYYTIFPRKNYTGLYGMYRIIDGNVYDETEDFDLGKYVPVHQFKEHINSMINKIKYYGE
jgi:hypothetical protein